MTPVHVAVVKNLNSVAARRTKSTFLSQTQCLTAYLIGSDNEKIIGAGVLELFCFRDTQR